MTRIAETLHIKAEIDVGSSDIEDFGERISSISGSILEKILDVKGDVLERRLFVESVWSADVLVVVTLHRIVRESDLFFESYGEETDEDKSRSNAMKLYCHVCLDFRSSKWYLPLIK